MREVFIPDMHPERFALNYELHARPFEPLLPPVQASYLALVVNAAARSAEQACLEALCLRYGLQPPTPQANHFAGDFGSFRLKFERHTEFTSYTFIVQGAVPDTGAESAPPVMAQAPMAPPTLFACPAIQSVPLDWLVTLPGQTLVAAHVVVIPAAEAPAIEALGPLFGGNHLIGETIADGAGMAITDFRVHEDGFSRFLIADRHLTSTQAGRMMQRLLEIETYLMLALATLPLARRMLPDLVAVDRQVVGITTAMSGRGDKDEPALLDQLTRLAADIENAVSASHYRLSAARAYRALVDRRVAELRGGRIEGLPTLREFIERRLAPAMDTCESVARLQTSLSERLGRAGDLLRTRVDIERDLQNQALLASMDQRGRIQLRLQETVEGLSVAAITYYLASLIGYLAKAAKTAGVSALHPDIAVAVSIPLLALGVYFGVRRLRHVLSQPGSDETLAGRG